MKFVTVPILILLLATQAFSKWVMLVEFRLNRDFIAANLCENRAKPQTKCGGKCQLVKAMAGEENSNAPVQQQKTKFTETLFPFEALTPDENVAAVSVVLFFSPETNRASHIPLFAVFRPPIV
jgi:hypothetical protein